MFMILNGYENIDSNIFFEIKESKTTRGHNYTLVKKQSRLDVRKYSFSQRTINVWKSCYKTELDLLVVRQQQLRRVKRCRESMKKKNITFL